MNNQEHYSQVSRLIVGYLTGELTLAELAELEKWINASNDHLQMMADFCSVCWHARQARAFEEPDKKISWHLIQEKVSKLPDIPPLPDLKETEWTVRKHASFLKFLRVLLLRRGGLVLS